MEFWPPLSTIVWSPYTWYFEFHTHGILKPISRLFWSATHSVSNPYPWYIEPPTHDILIPVHGILNPIPMVFWRPFHISLTVHGILTPYLWCIELPIHGILNSLAMLFFYLPMVFWPLSTFRLLSMVFLTHLSMVFCSPCLSVDNKWGGSKYRGDQFPYRGVGFQ